MPSLGWLSPDTLPEGGCSLSWKRFKRYSILPFVQSDATATSMFLKFLFEQSVKFVKSPQIDLHPRFFITPQTGPEK